MSALETLIELKFWDLVNLASGTADYIEEFEDTYARFIFVFNSSERTEAILDFLRMVSSEA